MKKIITSCFALAVLISAQSQSIEKSSIDSGGSSSTNGGIELLYTLGEVAVAERTSPSVLISEGFITSMLKIKLNLSLFLEGPFINPENGEETLMRDNLRLNDLIPTLSPYEDALTCESTVFSTSGNDAIVDWVWIEFRDSNDNNLVVWSRSALLQRDGDVVDVDGTSSLSFNSDEGNYFVAVSHRNHLGVLSAQAIALNRSSTTSIDFTNDISIINGGASSVKDLGNGSYALFAADFDGNGQIQNSDINGILPLLGTSFYSPADIDMNGQIQNTDINILLPNLGLGSQSGRYYQGPIPIFIIAPRR